MKTVSKQYSVNGPASLFIGRWQPFHEGHKKLIEKVLKTGKPVVIAIRDTEISKNNPLTLVERWTLIQKELGAYGELVKIITIPDIDEVCYGREVGYLIKRIHLDEETEKISGTNLRAQKEARFPIFWLTGQTGSGKSTIAKGVAKKVGANVLDGDEMRASISINAGFSKEDRHEHNLRVARLAQVLSQQNPVLVSVIAPFKETRKKISELIDPTWIHIKRTFPKEKHKPYENPKNPDLILDTDKDDKETNIKKLTSFLRDKIKV